MRRPSLRVIYTSAYLKNAWEGTLLPKPWTEDDLKQAIAQVCARSAAGADRGDIRWAEALFQGECRVECDGLGAAVRHLVREEHRLNLCLGKDAAVDLAEKADHAVDQHRRMSAIAPVSG